MSKAIRFQCPACSWAATLGPQSLQTEGYLECPDYGEQGLTIFSLQPKKRKAKKVDKPVDDSNEDG